MLVREVKRLLPFFGPLVLLLFLGLRLYDRSSVKLPTFGGASKDASSALKTTTPAQVPAPAPALGGPAKKPAEDAKQGAQPAGHADEKYREIFSVSTSDKKYFPVVFDRQHAINPNAIPHPTLNDTWIIVSQLQRSEVENTVWYAELICNAVFEKDKLSCIDPPFILPLSKTPVSIRCLASKWRI